MVAGLPNPKETPMTKLSDSQLVILGKACERADGAVYPVTTKLNGGPLAKVLTSLLTKGLIKEVRAKRDETVWRQDDEERNLTLYATPAAYKALGIEQDDGAATDTATPPSESKPKRSRAAKGAKAEKDKPARTRSDSKQARLIAMLKTAKGASIEEIVKTFGWQPHTVRGAIAGALKKKLGLDVTSEKIEGRGRVYRIAG
ncbi:MAG: DUF3489 domain-containing protein [Bauldia sp.]|nr:DUF3489 domain-containing protein [Bauldia sp.]